MAISRSVDERTLRAETPDGEVLGTSSRTVPLEEDRDERVAAVKKELDAVDRSIEAVQSRDRVRTHRASSLSAYGDYFVNVNAGKARVEAATSIELICGQSTILIEPASITITTPTFSVDAGMTAEVSGNLSATLKSSASTTVQGMTSVTIQGGMVKIN